ncbi:glycosyltransferase [Maridesulfovibrio frigidus]|uniref:glycosyltransferase n=1 Tax=Maridesulfovibrio frigidus TaxID=340956 RepID=UPI0004E1CBD0|nr:glycosyltransferase [Maridesulfovibrio frigidus]
MRTIIHHTALKKSGGATRVALIIYEGLKEAGYKTQHSFEASEEPGDQLISPAQAAKNIPPNSIVHFHSSANPTEFLAALPDQVKIVITMHDSQLITGGCTHPLDCTHFEKKCKCPCPRGFADSENIRQESIDIITKRKAFLISPSKWLANQTKIAEPKLSVKIIPNGIPWPENIGNKKQSREKIGLHPTSKVVLFIAHGGESAAYKSGPVWKKYWAGIKKNVPEAIGFAIGGDKNLREGDFIAIPYVDRETLSEFMTAADVLAYPTLADNHPLVTLEAMSKGLAAVSFAVGGVPEQITDGINGLLVAPFNKNSFIEKTSSLLLKQRLARELGEIAFQTGKKKFNSYIMLKSYKKRYHQLDLI